jgi:hypothetical protein
MRAIVAIKASPRLAANLINHCYTFAARAGNEVPCTDRVFSLSGNVEGILLREAAIDSFTLLSGHHGKGRPVRHVVISMEDCADPFLRTASFRRLIKMARQFVRKFARGARYIAIVHADRLHPHVHLIVCNSDGRRTLNWTPATLREMQSMLWTSLATSGRGTGKNKAVAVYPLARQLDAKTISTLTPEQINDLITAKQLSIGRVNRAGDLTSVVFNGRRVRLSTIQRFAATSATPRLHVDSRAGMESPAPRSPARRDRPRRRRTTARRRQRPMGTARTGALHLHVGAANAPTPRVAPGLRLALPGVGEQERGEPRVAEVATTQSLDRADPR